MISLEILSQLGEFIGGFGVIFTLIYLAIQLRSNTSSQRADMTARILERLSAQQRFMGSDAEANKFFLLAVTDPTKLSVEERSRYMWIMYEFYGSMEFLMSSTKLEMSTNSYGSAGYTLWTIGFPSPE